MALTATLAGCLTEATYLPGPDGPAPAALGIPHARFSTGPAGRPEWEHEAVAAWTRRAADLGEEGRRHWTETALALSGGGQDGAFGAGLLAGWTRRGDRPEFDYVTGVSTGALIAPFAYLGPAYDDRLKALFTGVDESDLIAKRLPVAALTDDALYDTAPLFQRIKAQVDDGMIEAIAREYKRGRLLLIATTDIVAARPTIWNLGAIASSGAPDAPELIRKILLASAAIPALFPPVALQWREGEREIRELHVDGGATIGQFLYSPTLRLRELPRPQGASNRIRAFVIRNGRLRPRAKAVAPQALAIAARAVEALTASQGLGDLYREYELARRDRVEVKYASIGEDFSPEPASLFDRAYMGALYAYGEAAGAAGGEWSATPPGFER